MKKIITLLLMSLFATTATAFAHHEINAYSWKTYQEIINVPTENEQYTHDDLIKNSSLIIKAKFTGARKTKESATGSIYTISQVKVISKIKGSSDKKIMIVEPAYVFQDVYYQFDHYSFLEANKTYRLYLVKVKGNWTLINPAQGKEQL